MFEFFGAITEIIKTLIYYFLTLIQSVIQFIEHLVKGINFVVQTIGWLPPFCRGALLAIVGISIVTMLISSHINNA